MPSCTDDDRHRLLRAAAATLPGETARLDAEILLAHVLGLERLAMLGGREPVGAAQAARFDTLLARRRRHEPIAYIIGQREFWSLDLRVTPDVLIPRADSETLIVAALESGARPATILDLGTGSGALLLAALSQWPQAWGLGVDRSAAALRVARDNAQRLGFGDRAHFVRGDWGRALGARFDLILCNPPYVEAAAELGPDVADHEPATALFAGPDGLDAYREILPRLSGLLTDGGMAIVEFGVGQEAPLMALAAGQGLGTRLRHDLGGRPRALILSCRDAAGVGKGLLSL